MWRWRGSTAVVPRWWGTVLLLLRAETTSLCSSLPHFCFGFLSSLHSKSSLLCSALFRFLLFFPPKGCCFFPSFSKILPPQFVPLFLKKIVPLPPGSVLSPVFIGSRGRGSPYPVHVQGMVVWELQGMVV